MKNLREARRKAGLTQKELAELLNVDVRTIINWEKSPTNSQMLLEKAFKICEEMSEEEE